MWHEGRDLFWLHCSSRILEAHSNCDSESCLSCPGFWNLPLWMAFSKTRTRTKNHWLLLEEPEKKNFGSEFLSKKEMSLSGHLSVVLMMDLDWYPSSIIYSYTCSVYLARMCPPSTLANALALQKRSNWQILPVNSPFVSLRMICFCTRWWNSSAWCLMD